EEVVLVLGVDVRDAGMIANNLHGLPEPGDSKCVGWWLLCARGGETRRECRCSDGRAKCEASMDAWHTSTCSSLDPRSKSASCRRRRKRDYAARRIGDLDLVHAMSSRPSR